MSRNGLETFAASRAPDRSTRATSGTTTRGSAHESAPWSEKTMSKDSSGSGISSADAWKSGKSTPASAMSPRACSSCREELSSPTGRAPRFASSIDQRAAPQPSSRMSLPATSPRAPTSDSGIDHAPQIRSSTLSCGPWTAWYSSDSLSQCSRLRSAWSEGGIGKPEVDFPRRRLGRVGAVHKIVRHRKREVAANRARRRVGGVGGTHGRPHGRDRALALEHERERRRRGDEIDELAEERLLPVLRVVLFGELAVDGEELGGAHLQPAPLEAAEDLAGERALDRVGLDQDECPSAAIRPG